MPACLSHTPSSLHARLLGLTALFAAALVQAPAVLANSHQHEGHASEHAHGSNAHHGDAHGSAELIADEHADNPIVQAYREANERMHAGMMLGFTGIPDVDFARGMIPHHQGAIEMAEVMLEHGEDEELKALAREIIDAQEDEIAFLKQWLEVRGH